MFQAEALVRAGVLHGFTSRSMPGSLAPTLGESDGVIAQRWAEALEPQGLSPERLVVLNQVHGANVVRVDTGKGPMTPIADADAAITTQRGVPLSVKVADCVPVLLAAPGVIGAVHAGWRGTAAGIVPASVAALCEAGEVQAHQVVAAIGPSIAPCCFEVGEEVVAGLSALVSPDVFVREGKTDRPYVDLRAANRQMLLDCGVTVVETVGPCTACSADLFSYRAEHGVTGRQVGFIALPEIGV